MKQPLSIFVTSFFLLIVSFKTYSAATPSAEADEIQVLIDVSGSMKQNDPDNQRIEATQLLINLLPDGSKAGLWLFAEKTSLLSKTDSANAAWKQQALKASSQIHSRGLFTHIEDAIQTVLKDGFKGQGRKHLVLLTDGVVDISKDIMISADSRERVLTELSQQLKQQEIKVQTIALSDQADKELLQNLAMSTGGAMQSSQSAEQLQKMFLKTAQKAAPKPTVPISGNHFNVDASIKEFSVLVFKKPKAAPTQLIAPDQKVFTHKIFTTMISWLESTSYDLINVKQPMPGEWTIDAVMDPDNQVMILTDLQLQLNELPNFIGEQQSLPLKAHFTEQGKLITREDFLGLASITLSIDNHPEQQALTPITGNTGYFSYTLPELSKGSHSLSIVADGKTFKRELLRQIEVISAPISVEKLIDAQKRLVTLSLKPDTTVLDISAITINASIQKAGKDAQIQVIPAKDGEWILHLEDLAAGSSTQVEFQVTAKTLDGRTITPTLLPITIDDNFFTPEPTAHEAHATENEHGIEEEHVETTEAPAVEQASWGLVSAIVIGINLLLIGAGFLSFKAMQKATLNKQQQLLERLA